MVAAHPLQQADALDRWIDQMRVQNVFIKRLYVSRDIYVVLLLEAGGEYITYRGIPIFVREKM